MPRPNRDTAITVRKLWISDRSELTAHLLRLVSHDRWMRFGASVEDGFVETYASKLLNRASLVLGAFVDGQLRAIGELHWLRDSWPVAAEIALSVEQDWQNQGIGGKLMDRMTTIARNRGVTTLHVLYMSDNEKMRRLAAQHHFEVKSAGQQISAEQHLYWPTPMSFAREILDDSAVMVREVFTFADK